MNKKQSITFFHLSCILNNIDKTDEPFKTWKAEAFVNYMKPCLEYKSDNVVQIEQFKNIISQLPSSKFNCIEHSLICRNIVLVDFVAKDITQYYMAAFMGKE